MKTSQISERILLLQNPRNCSKVKTLICEVKQICGFLCQLHFLMVCFTQAYYLNRTVIFKDSGIESINRFQNSYNKFGKCSSYKSNSKLKGIKNINFFL